MNKLKPDQTLSQLIIAFILTLFTVLYILALLTDAMSGKYYFMMAFSMPLKIK